MSAEDLEVDVSTWHATHEGGTKSYRVVAIQAVGQNSGVVITNWGKSDRMNFFKVRTGLNATTVNNEFNAVTRSKGDKSGYNVDRRVTGDRMPYRDFMRKHSYMGKMKSTDARKIEDWAQGLGAPIVAPPSAGARQSVVTESSESAIEKARMQDPMWGTW